MTHRSLSRTLAKVAAALAVLNGCGLVAGLGDPRSLDPSGSPGRSKPYVAQAVALGASHACATVTVGTSSQDTVLCWGSNPRGQLGTDPRTVAASSTPLPVSAFPAGFDPVELTLAAGYSCAISKDSHLACWGDVPFENPIGGVHREAGPAAYEPAFMYDLKKPLYPVEVASVGPGGGCVVEQHELICWGTPVFTFGVDGGANVSPPDYRSVSVGGTNACALETAAIGGGVACWGDDRYGQSGGSVGGTVLDPSPVALTGDLVEVAVGRDFACALRGDGSVACWGDNQRGQLGPGGPPGASATPVPVPFADGYAASALVVGDAHACVVKTDPYQTVECWGDDSKGQLGRGGQAPSYSATAAKVQRRKAAGSGTEDLPHVVQISAGGDTTCVVRVTDPEVSCWGANDSGQAGQTPSARVDLATPVVW